MIINNLFQLFDYFFTVLKNMSRFNQQKSSITNNQIMISNNVYNNAIKYLLC